MDEDDPYRLILGAIMVAFLLYTGIAFGLGVLVGVVL
jgi:hypothetical protein